MIKKYDTCHSLKLFAPLGTFMMDDNRLIRYSLVCVSMQRKEKGRGEIYVYYLR